MTRSTWADEWEQTYGRHWATKLAVLGVLLVIRGFLETLSDADLPMHLAIGEWIVRHRGVPVVEPFAWSRSGAPFYAYSWAMDVVMYRLAETTGKVGLRLLQGLMMAGAGASMIVLGRAARWDPRTSLLIAALNVFILATVVSSVRPQAILFTLVPLAWAFTYRALYSDRPRGAIVGLAILSVIAVNTHIFFPLIVAPWLLWLADPPRERWRVYAVVGVTLAGWLITPYVLVWPQMFSASLQPNLLLSPPTPVKEAQPGFVSMGAHWSLIPLAFFLGSLPLLWSTGSPSRRHRLVWGLAWLAGLMAFAIAARMLLLWWMLVLPLAAAGIHAIARYLLANEDQGRRLWRITAVWVVCVLLLLSIGSFEADAWSFEDPARHRLAPMKERGLDQLAKWLECNTREKARGKVYTVFNYGSALTWRLPNYSMSIDGRTIFPDSVAKAEAYLRPLRDTVSYGPWRSAELAIIPTSSTVADVMRHAPGWREITIVDLAETAASLWVTDAWWSRFGRVPLPRYPLSLVTLDDESAPPSCAALVRRAPKT
ncbi:MAG: hypothetical protein ABI681_06045 [Gemmatimonadales bacterium]